MVLVLVNTDAYTEMSNLLSNQEQHGTFYLALVMLVRR